MDGQPCERLPEVRCPTCGGLRAADSLIEWRGGKMCVRCSVRALEEELHGAPADFRREAAAMNDERRFATRRADADFRGENPVRGW